ncbi:MAG: peptidase S9 [Verrucomicrobiales bacterium]|nr:peptidase S9 [Verrucomicrobiales bacterium]|tara:strand:+ start:602 stop:1447 length:846 start_codon:yes stop_codon:yes gene_type:complete
MRSKPKLLLVALALPFVASAQLVKLEGAKVVQYKQVGEAKLFLHVFNPDGHEASASRPAIIFFFGGGWVGGTPKQFETHCRHLASHGMVAITAEYRVKSRNKTTPFACVADGKSAIRFVRTNAGKLGVDPARIAAGGGSAGGHVASATGNCPGLEEKGEDGVVSSKPNALVLFNPVYDNGPKGYGHDRVKTRWKEISPMHNLRKGAPPTIVFLGTQDKLIPVSTGREYDRRMKAIGSRSELHLYDGATHGFFNEGRKGDHYADTIKKMDAFLVKLGWLKEK